MKKTQADAWEGYEVTLQYPPKIDVSEEELTEKLTGALKTVNGLYLSEVNQARMEKREVRQLNL